MLTLARWRKQFQEQQVAFRPARAVCARWANEQSDVDDEEASAIPVQSLFPKVAFAAKRYLREKVICKGTTEPCDVLLVGKYQQQAVDPFREKPVDELKAYEFRNSFVYILLGRHIPVAKFPRLRQFPIPSQSPNRHL